MYYVVIAVYNDGVVKQELCKNGWALMKAISRLDVEELQTISVTQIHPEIESSKQND